MPSDKYGDLPHRPPLSVPFPLHLGDEFHLGSAETLQDAANQKSKPVPVAGREPRKRDGHERVG